MPKESIPRSKSGRIMDYLANRSNVGKPFRSIKKLMDDPPSLTGPIRKEDIERSFDAAGVATAGSMTGRRPSNSVGTGGRQYKVKGAEPHRTATATRGRVPKEGEKKFVGPSRPPRAGEKKFIGPTRPPRSGDKDFIGPRQPPRSGDRDFIGPRQPPRSGEKDFIGPTRPPKSGDKDFIGPVRPSKAKGTTFKRKLAIGAGLGAGSAALVSSYKPAKKSEAERKSSRGADFPKGKGVPSMKREPSTEPSGKIPTPTTKPARPTTGGQSFKDKMQGRNWKGGASGGAPKSSAPVKKAGDKSRVASGYKGNWAGAGSARKPKTFQEAVRRNQTEEYTKARMRPKKNLLELFKKKR